MRSGPSNQSGLRFISGIIPTSKVLRFERMLFRATRGNMLFNQAPADKEIMDPVSTEMVFILPVTANSNNHFCFYYLCALEDVNVIQLLHIGMSSPYLCHLF